MHPSYGATLYFPWVPNVISRLILEPKIYVCKVSELVSMTNLPFGTNLCDNTLQSVWAGNHFSCPISLTKSKIGLGMVNVIVCIFCCNEFFACSHSVVIESRSNLDWLDSSPALFIVTKYEIMLMTLFNIILHPFAENISSMVSAVSVQHNHVFYSLRPEISARLGFR